MGCQSAIGIGANHRVLGSTGGTGGYYGNGIATDDDGDRQHYLIAHLEQIAKAQREAVDIRGYFHWSALDNFEWAEGYRPRFGLIDVNYETLERTPRPSAELYRKIIAMNQEQPGDHPIIVPSALQ